jgi:hypothetical protein
VHKVLNRVFIPICLVREFSSIFFWHLIPLGNSSLSFLPIVYPVYTRFTVVNVCNRTHMNSINLCCRGKYEKTRQLSLTATAFNGNGFQGSSRACTSVVLPRQILALGIALYLTSHPGVLFICFNVDHRVLYTELSEEVISDGFQFYTTFFNAPPAIKVCSCAHLPYSVL